MTRLSVVKLLSRGLGVVLILSLAHDLAGMTWLFLEGSVLSLRPVERPVVASEEEGAVETGSHSVALATSGSLFGRIVVGEKNGVVSASGDLPQTSLDLLLLGVLYHDDPRLSLAVIMDAEGWEGIRRVGSLLADGTQIISIFPDRVVLRHQGVEELLRLPEKEDKSLREKFRHRVERQQEVSRVWDQFSRKPAQVLEMVRLDPAHEGGRLIGVRINPGRDAGLLKRFGLKGGDVITWVNGAAMDSVENGMTALRKLGNARSIHFKVLRNGQTLDFSYRRSADSLSWE